MPGEQVAALPPIGTALMLKESTMTDANTAQLVKLGDTEMTVADPSEDVRGRTVVDRNGEELGTADSLLIDEQEGKVRFLQIASGGFLGIAQDMSLLPVDAVTRITADRVVVDQTREHVAGAPAYDPDLAFDRGYYGSLYGYYGYTPYWGAGYVYPGYPYYL
jgi:sporulation protein YlmC with PRC-barrel domain